MVKRRILIPAMKVRFPLSLPKLDCFVMNQIGEMPERLNGAVLKTVGPKGSVGSNPTLSATECFGSTSFWLRVTGRPSSYVSPRNSIDPPTRQKERGLQVEPGSTSSSRTPNQPANSTS